MKKLALILVLIALQLLGASQIEKDAEVIASRLAPDIDISQPVILDIRCGEWTAALFHSLSSLLLERGADLRDFPLDVLDESEQQGFVTAQIADYGLESAILVSIDLNFQWKTIEHKSLFSYRSERLPEYIFGLKQIQLPEHQIKQIGSFAYSPPNSRDASLSAPRLRWFEPLFATAALASIIFLLWTIE